MSPPVPRLKTGHASPAIMGLQIHIIPVILEVMICLNVSGVAMPVTQRMLAVVSFVALALILLKEPICALTALQACICLLKGPLLVLIAQSVGILRLRSRPRALPVKRVNSHRVSVLQVVQRVKIARQISTRQIGPQQTVPPPAHPVRRVM